MNCLIVVVDVSVYIFSSRTQDPPVLLVLFGSDLIWGGVMNLFW